MFTEKGMEFLARINVPSTYIAHIIVGESKEGVTSMIVPTTITNLQTTGSTRSFVAGDTTYGTRNQTEFIKTMQTTQTIRRESGLVLAGVVEWGFLNQFGELLYYKINTDFSGMSIVPRYYAGYNPMPIKIISDKVSFIDTVYGGNTLSIKVVAKPFLNPGVLVASIKSGLHMRAYVPTTPQYLYESSKVTDAEVVLQEIDRINSILKYNIILNNTVSIKNNPYLYLQSGLGDFLLQFWDRDLDVGLTQMPDIVEDQIIIPFEIDLRGI